MKTEFNKDFIGIFENSIDTDTLNELLEWFDVLIELGYSRKVCGLRDEFVTDNNAFEIDRAHHNDCEKDIWICRG